MQTAVVAFKLTIIALAFLVSAIGSICAQEKTAMSADQTLRGSGRVNASTLGMEFSLPLGSYPGRGMNAPISLSYSSKVWRMKYLHDTEGPIVSGGCRSVNEAQYGEDSASGWTTSLAVPYIEYTGRNNLFNDRGFPKGNDECVNSTPNNYQNAWIRRLTIHLPSGETHELRADDTRLIYPPTSSCPTNGIYPCDPNDPDLQANWNRTFYAVDGSNLKYIEDSTTNTYRLLMPDGSYYDFAGTQVWGTEGFIRNAVRITDRNGNFSSFDAGTGILTDTLGRTLSAPIGNEAPSAPATQTYTMPGMTGTYKFHWKQLKGASAGESGLTDFNQDLKYRGPHIRETTNGNWDKQAVGTYLFDSELQHYVLSGDDLFNPVVLTEIELPTGQSYKFSYDIFGMIEKIVYPTGGEEEFVYDTVGTLSESEYGNITDQANFGVVGRKVYPEAEGGFYEWTYSAGYAAPNGYQVTVNNPDGTQTKRILHRDDESCYGCTYGKYGFGNVLAGMPYEERAYDSSSPRKLLSHKLTTWTSTTFAAQGQGVPSWHPRVTKEESIIYDPVASTSLSASTTTTYASLSAITDVMLPIAVNQYGFSTTIRTLGTLERTIETDYVTDSNYTARNMRSLPFEVRTKDGSGNVKAKAQFVYDEVGTYPLISAGTDSQWTDPGTNYRGNVTTAKSYYDIGNSLYVQSHAQYDNFGNLRKAWDANGNMTETVFSSTYAYAYPTSVLTPIPDTNGTYGSSTAFTASTVYDFDTGLPTSTTDANGQTTAMEYVDPLLRPTKVTAPNGAETITEYGAGTDAATRWVKVSSQIDATNWKEAISWFDGLGRTIKSQSVDSAGDVFTENLFDAFGRPWKTSNPYRTGETVYWTENFYDDAGRPYKVKTPDNAEVETAYGIATSGSHLGTVVTVNDQAEKQRRSVTNALGQLVRVDEPTTSGLGTISSPNQATVYVYDKLNNLTTVTQGVQTRTFGYDALSRLKQATNPESGTISYTYDANSNLATKTDARLITTSYAYDALNRVKTRTYSDSTPAVSYFYDNLTNAKGKLIKVASSVSTTEYTAFDILGRVTSHKQTTDGTAYTTGYTYNLSGALIEETYPSGRKVKNTLDVDGDLSMVQTQASGGAWQTRANNFAYNAAGAVTSLQLGNGRWESTMFNSRLQPTQTALGTTQNATDLLKLNYSYGTTANNGNVLSQTITVPGLANPFIQTYSYDPLNRLESATETSNSIQTWMQNFGYDRYGNRNITSGTGQTSLTFSGNRITSTSYTFDNAGNTTTDPSGRAFVYDAENKQTSVSDTSGPIGQYYYDGDGKRVKKVSNTENIAFVYDAAGKLIEERDASTGTLQTTYVYAGSRLLSTETASGTSYLTNDHLGSARINTDASGQVISRHDYHPFGEEVARSGYGSDTIRKQFTGYERDNETGLDFAQARYFASDHGRFSSPDPVAGDQLNPQSLNRYPYVLNNPLVFTDPTGLEVSWEDSEKKKKKGETEAKTDAQRAYENRLDDMINSGDKKTREKGERLKADYGRLQKSDIVFHVVKENPEGTSSGELYYKGQEGHLYVSLKGDASAAGSIPLTQKLGHEFKHGVQFLDGQLGFAKNSKGEWRGYRDDLVDEADAWSAGFDAQPADPGQRAGSERKFLDSMATAYPFGIKALVDAMDRSGPYKGRSKTQIPITNVTPSIYAIPRIK